MKKIQLTYDPYRMKTTLEIGGTTLTNKNGHTSTSSDDYTKINKYLQNKTPLQTWIEPILYDNWKGFVSEVFGDERNDECTIEFNGREIDYDDFCRSLNSQNEKRDKTKRIMFTFKHNKVLNDKTMADNIENVVKQLNEDWFKAIVEKRESETLQNNYHNMNKAYGDALSNEFIIVFAGMYSSGKSTLLNVLIRHDVLPMNTETCTSVNCHIVHDSKMADGIAMYGYAGGKSLFGKRVFRDDDKCRAEFQRLCPMDGTPPYPELDKMELHVDLSHLYPASIDPKTFRLVLIDTPGINSAKSEEDGVNHHSDIAIEAITMKNKPMIIFCVDKNNKEDNHVGEFMGEILTRTQGDTGFNDRFLFVINKSDLHSDRPSKEVHDNFAKYLKNPSKWGLDNSKKELKELADKAKTFVPRIFLASSGISYTIQQGLPALSEDEQKELPDDLSNALDVYETFAKKIKQEKENYYLSSFCDIPQYRKQAIISDFEEAKNNNDTARATELQTGICALEMAVQDYIERYAYPIKVRDLLKTFEDILGDVHSFTEATVKTIEKMNQSINNETDERTEKERQRLEIEEKIQALDKVKESIDEQLTALNELNSDDDELRVAVNQYINEIKEDSMYAKIRNHTTISTGQNSHSEIEAEIKSLHIHLSRIFAEGSEKLNQKVEDIQNEHERKMEKILSVLRDIVTILEDQNLLTIGNFHFMDNITWRKNFSNINSDHFINDLKQSIIDKSTIRKKVTNDYKYFWRYSRNPFKIAVSWFMPEKVKETTSLNGSYDVSKINKIITEHFNQLISEQEDMTYYLTESIGNTKKETKELMTELYTELQNFQIEIQKITQLVDEKNEQIDQTNDILTTQKEQLRYLNTLTLLLQGEGI